MLASGVEFGQLVTIIIMAIALGLDAFSLGIGIGMKGIRLIDIMKISFVIGIFHVLMPLMGMFMGQYVSLLLGNVATAAGGCLLILLGSHMVYSSIRGEEATSFDHRSIWGLTIFSLSVSIDSFSVGVSLGMFATDIVLTVLIFGLFGGLLSIAGLLVGRRVSGLVGEYGEAFGGLILLTFGIKFLL
ncbi:putative Mn2+ efflux pump MntP [Paenibacillus sp. V4I3]|uniref:manganese efflux pump MntP n=1 Tax=unclassified Paenibacillus TaxID=185978 RepID=UPI002787FDCC|nr:MULTISPECIES: manganese efflux pump MntP family protein [unclassified Paenibacillus]MDQ0872215.1 putative Mn2+ efflux pump MntP [Paenibacillus sp. V4I3]MDQ0891902.1 putative Mn2+ efflux pump MntP [Paenibacillus sp. V4I9]